MFYCSIENRFSHLVQCSYFRWVHETGQTGTVMTLTELLEEGETSPWKGVSHEVLLKAGVNKVPYPPNLNRLHLSLAKQESEAGL